MTRAGYTASEIQSTIDFLLSRRYLDDPTFARELARSRAERKHWGPLRIERRLRELGVEESNIEAALSYAFPEGQDDAAIAALTRFLGSKGPWARDERARAYRHLLSRGFSGEVAYRLVSGSDLEDTE
ncbi:MAG TPA: regulatory protein RecX [Vicinamibacteria bacterium]|nr:regulatory protein RecX [Vicinamibacteria bacterium]